ncbi:MAG: hypothetical protein LUH07_05300 [Lachnospiraceae bacterium]|nr:hypothetical protein [Lachnospiraceae bacterium]
MKDYVKPTMKAERFAANEYIATCYTVTCDYHAENYNSVDHYDANGNYISSGGYPCGAQYTFKSDTEPVGDTYVRLGKGGKFWYEYPNLYFFSSTNPGAEGDHSGTHYTNLDSMTTSNAS